MMARGGETDPFRVGRNRVPKRFRKARIGVFWDLEQCQLPAFCGGAEIVDKFRSAVSSWGYEGELQIVVIGDTNFIESGVVDDLQGAGITFSHIHSEKGRTGLQVFNEMVWWLPHKNEPANILFISKISENRCLLLKHFRSFSTDYSLKQKSLAPQTDSFEKYFWDWSDFLDGQLIRPRTCCWGYKENYSIYYSYFLDRGGNESDDLTNKYYQPGRGWIRLSSKKKPRDKASLSRPRACCWGDNENDGINNNYYQDRGGNERDDINNNYYQHRRGRKRLSGKKKPRDKASLSRPRACCWGDNENDGINNNYYQYKGGNERDDINNNYYQYRRGRKRLSRKKKPCDKASMSRNSWDEKNKDGKAKNCRYKPY